MALTPAGSNPLLLSLLLLFSVTCSYGNQNQQFINSCGDIHNISFPFQLQGDPSITCNDNNFTLSCDENNRTVLHLFSGKYYVKSINYTGHSIRLADVGFQSNDICSAFPPSSLTFCDFYSASTVPYRVLYEDASSVVFLTCENPVQYPSIYINKTGYCNSTRDNSGNGYYSYALAGDVSTWGVADSCLLEACYLSSSPLVRERKSNLSRLDLNKVLEYGFEASWDMFLHSCSSMYCRKRASCFGDSVNFTAVCNRCSSYSLSYLRYFWQEIIYYRFLWYINVDELRYSLFIENIDGRLLLLLTTVGKRRNWNSSANSSQIFFPSWVYDQFAEGKNVQIGEITEEESMMVNKMMLVALWCIQMRPSDRPSINKVIEMLEGNIELLQMPPKPFLYSQGMHAENNGMNERLSNLSGACMDSLTCDISGR